MPEKLESLSPPCQPRGWVSPLSLFYLLLPTWCGGSGTSEGWSGLRMVCSARNEVDYLLGVIME